MAATRTVVASMVVAAVTLAGCTGQEDATDARAADDVRPGVSAEDCDDPTLTQAEWTQFCVDAGLQGEAEANADPFTLANGEPKTFANGEVVTVTSSRGLHRPSWAATRLRRTRSTTPT